MWTERAKDHVHFISVRIESVTSGLFDLTESEEFQLVA